MVKKVLLALVLLVVAFGVYVAMQPSQFRVERSLSMAASAEEIFGHVNNLGKWEAWSPWAKLDPEAKNSFEGPAEGEGAMFKWSGNHEVGEGTMTIVESKPFELVRIKLEFVRPFEDVGMSAFNLEPDGDLTKVTWSMSGENNYVAKLMCVFMDMDEMIGGQYEKGLGRMKELVEKP